MELKRRRIFITIAGQLLTNLGTTIFTSKIQCHLQVVRCKIMMRASSRYGVIAILVLQPLNGAIHMQRICTGAVLNHVRHTNLTKMNVTH